MLGTFRIQIPIYFYFLPIFSCGANSQSLGQQQQALDAITNTADRICTVVNAEGSSKSAKVTGEVNAQLDGLLKKIIESGIGFKGQYNAETYKGVFQEDLPTILKSTQDCKKGVFDKLVDPLLLNPASSSTSGSLATTRPAFDLSDNTVTNFNGTAIINNPQGIFTAKGNARINFQGGVISGNGPIEFPSPTGEFSNFSNDDLRSKAQEMAQKLRTFQRQIDQARDEIDHARSKVKVHFKEEWKAASRQFGKKLNSLSVENDREFKATLWNPSKAIASEIIKRTGPVEVFSDPEKPNSRENKRLRAIFDGAATVATGNLAGSAEKVAEFLDFIAEKLPAH